MAALSEALRLVGGAGITIPKREFVKEHTKLVRVLTKGTAAQRRREAKDQSAELKKELSGGVLTHSQITDMDNHMNDIKDNTNLTRAEKDSLIYNLIENVLNKMSDEQAEKVPQQIAVLSNFFKKGLKTSFREASKAREAMDSLIDTLLEKPNFKRSKKKFPPIRGGVLRVGSRGDGSNNLYIFDDAVEVAGPFTTREEAEDALRRGFTPPRRLAVDIPGQEERHLPPPPPPAPRRRRARSPETAEQRAERQRILRERAEEAEAFRPAPPATRPPGGAPPSPARFLRPPSPPRGRGKGKLRGGVLRVESRDNAFYVFDDNRQLGGPFTTREEAEALREGYELLIQANAQLAAAEERYRSLIRPPRSRSPSPPRTPPHKRRRLETRSNTPVSEPSSPASGDSAASDVEETGGSRSSGFIQRMMAETKKKHKGKYRNPTAPLPKGSTMNAPVAFDYFKMPKESRELSKFIMSHFFKVRPYRAGERGKLNDYELQRLREAEAGRKRKSRGKKGGALRAADTDGLGWVIEDEAGNIVGGPYETEEEANQWIATTEPASAQEFEGHTLKPSAFPPIVPWREAARAPPPRAPPPRATKRKLPPSPSASAPKKKKAASPPPPQPAPALPPPSAELSMLADAGVMT